MKSDLAAWQQNLEQAIKHVDWETSIALRGGHRRARHPRAAAAHCAILKQSVCTADGVEVIFATNHLGPFLLTDLLLDTLKADAPSRVLTVAAKGLMTYPFLSIEFDNLNGQKQFSTQHADYHSKIAQIMFAFDLAERLHGQVSPSTASA